MPEDKSEELEKEEQSEDTQGAGDQAEEEQSTDSFDASKLTPELQKVYKSMQSDYTKKTQKLADSRKTLEQKEQSIEQLREQYEQKLYELTQPKGEEKPLVDTSQMTSEQKQAWETLNQHFDKKLEKIRQEERKSFEDKITALQGQLGDMAWRSFERDNPGASKYRDMMRDIWQAKGGVKCPLTLDELLTLAQKDDLKKIGAEEYKQRVKGKKEAVTTKPGSTAGTEAELEFSKGPGVNPQRRREDIEKALKAADDDIVSGKIRR